MKKWTFEEDNEKSCEKYALKSLLSIWEENKNTVEYGIVELFYQKLILRVKFNPNTRKVKNTETLMSLDV